MLTEAKITSYCRAFERFEREAAAWAGQPGAAVAGTTQQRFRTAIARLDSCLAAASAFLQHAILCEQLGYASERHAPRLWRERVSAGRIRHALRAHSTVAVAAASRCLDELDRLNRYGVPLRHQPRVGEFVHDARAKLGQLPDGCRLHFFHRLGVTPADKLLLGGCDPAGDVRYLLRQLPEAAHWTDDEVSEAASAAPGHSPAAGPAETVCKDGRCPSRRRAWTLFAEARAGDERVTPRDAYDGLSPTYRAEVSKESFLKYLRQYCQQSGLPSPAARQAPRGRSLVRVDGRPAD